MSYSYIGPVCVHPWCPLWLYHLWRHKCACPWAEGCHCHSWESWQGYWEDWLSGTVWCEYYPLTVMWKCLITVQLIMNIKAKVIATSWIENYRISIIHQWNATDAGETEQVSMFWRYCICTKESCGQKKQVQGQIPMWVRVHKVIMQMYANCIICNLSYILVLHSVIV